MSLMSSIPSLSTPFANPPFRCSLEITSYFLLRFIYTLLTLIFSSEAMRWRNQTKSYGRLWGKGTERGGGLKLRSDENNSFRSFWGFAGCKRSFVAMGIFFYIILGVWPRVKKVRTICNDIQIHPHYPQRRCSYQCAKRSIFYNVKKSHENYKMCQMALNGAAVCWNLSKGCFI